MSDKEYYSGIVNLTSRGLNTFKARHLLNPDEAPVFDNITTSNVLGAIRKRDGYAQILVGAFLSHFPYDLQKYKFNENTALNFYSSLSHLTLTSNAVIHQSNSTLTVHTNITGAAIINRPYFSFFNNIVYISNAIGGLFKHTVLGGAITAVPAPGVAANRPAKLQAIATFQGRLWLAKGWPIDVSGVEKDSSTIYASALNNGDDWTTTGENGLFNRPVFPNENGNIRALLATKEILYIFKDSGVYGLYGDTPSNYRIDPILSFGLNSKLDFSSTMSLCKPFAYNDTVFFSTIEGAYVLRGRNYVRISDPLRKSDGFSALFIPGFIGRHGNQIAFGPDTSAGKSTLFVYDTDIETWSKYLIANNTVITRGMIDIGKDQIILAQKDDGTGNIIFLDSLTGIGTYNDAGATYTMAFETKDYDFNEFDVMKQLREIYVFAKATGTTTITVQVIADGVNKGTAGTINVATTGGRVEVVGKIQVPASLNAKGRRFGLRFTNTSSLEIEIRGYSMKAVKIADRELTGDV